MTYAVPDATWDDYKAKRVLTGRDFDVEGLAGKSSWFVMSLVEMNLTMPNQSSL